MSFALCFWVLMLLWLVLGIWDNWPGTSGGLRPLGGTVLLFILLALVGWKVFGPALHG